MLLPAGGAVQGSCLIEAGVDAEDRGHVEDHAKADLPPLIDEGQDEGPPLGLLIEGRRTAGPALQRLGKEAGGGRQVGVDQIGDDDHAHQVGQEDGGHIEFLFELADDLIDEDGGGDAQNGAQDDPEDVVKQGVADHDPGVGGAEEELEVLQPAPGAGPHALGIAEILKGDLQARQRQIVVDKQIQQAGNAHDVKRDPLLEVPLFLLFLIHAVSPLFKFS